MSSSEDEGKNICCAYCVKYSNYISVLQQLLDENGIEYTPLRKKKEKVIPDVMPVINLSIDRIEDLVNEHYNEETFRRGCKGVIEFIYKYVIRDDNDNIVYICSDNQKKIFKYYDEGGLQIDPRCKNLIDYIYDPLLKKVNKIYRIAINKLYDEEELEKESDEESSDEEDEYDEDMEEVIAEEFMKGSKKDEKDGKKSTVDERVNETVAIFLEIKKGLGNVRKPIVDELVDLLSF